MSDNEDQDQDDPSVDDESMRDQRRVARDLRRDAAEAYATERARAAELRAAVSAEVAKMMATAAARTTGPTLPNPRIGGGTGSDSWWTGGPNLAPRTKAHTAHAGRPSDFKSASKVQEVCTKGLAENRQLGTADDKENTITLTSWVNEIRANMEQSGMDTVFWVRASNTKECYLLRNYGELDSHTVAVWTDELKTGVDGANVCQFDLENLLWSGMMIKNSISVRLWEELEANLNYEASGPEIFIAVMERFQHNSSSAVRTLVKQLTEMKLVKEPGMNVDTFSMKISEVVRRIEGQKASSIPTDLSVIVIQCYLDTDVDEFKMEASGMFNKLDKNPKAMDWREIATTLKTSYRSLVGLNRWPHKDGKSKQNDFAALQGSINALTEKIGNMGNSQGNGKSPSDGKCFNCGETGHLTKACTKPRTQSPPVNPADKWTRKGPESGEPHTKTVGGIEYTWCARCGRWRKDANRHLTAAHKTRAELTAGTGGTANPAPAPAPAPRPAPAPAPAPPTVANPQGNVGGLRMMGGLFCGTIKQTDSHLN